MRRAVVMTGMVLSAWMLMSCTIVKGKAPPADVRSIDSALVYGYVESSTDVIERVDFIEYGRVYIPPFKKPPRVLVFDNGMFMAENVNPGNYVISGFRSDLNHYNLATSKRQAYQRIFRIEAGEVEYIGSFNVRPLNESKTRSEKFEVTVIQRPGERDVLKHLYHITEGTAWQEKIAKRLKQLRQY